MKKCPFCKVKLKMKVGHIRGVKGKKHRTTIDYYWCPVCKLMYKGEIIEGFRMGD